MPEFKICYLNTYADLVWGFGGIRSSSEIFVGSFEEVTAKAETTLEFIKNDSGTSNVDSLFISIYERKRTKFWMIIPVIRESLVWQKGKVSKGALPVRVIA